MYYFFFISKILIIDAQLLSLTSSPQLNDLICPGPIEFTCVGTGLPFILQWRLNDTIYGRHLFEGNTSSVNIPLNPPIPGVMAQVTSVSRNQDNVSINITSTLSGGTSILEGSSVQCASLPFTSNPHTVRVRGFPPSPFLTSCNLLFLTEHLSVTFQWNSSFNSQHAVEKYRVAVTPDLLECSRELSSGENYSCNGLQIGMTYLFRINAINCVDQEGLTETFTLVLQVPEAPDILKVSALYEGSPSVLNQINVKWNDLEVVDSQCFYGSLLNYTIITVESLTARIRHRVLSEEVYCNNYSICSVSFPVLPLDYTVYSSAIDVFGREVSPKVYPELIPGFSYPLLNYTLKLKNGTIFAMCSTNTERIGNCTVQYGKDSVYQNLSAPVIGPVNSLFPIVDVETTVTYYHQASVIINSSLEIIIKSIDTFTNDVLYSTYTASTMTPSMAATSHPPLFPMNSSPAVNNDVTLKIYQLGLAVFVVIILILALGTAIIIIVLLLQKAKSQKKLVTLPENQHRIVEEDTQNPPLSHTTDNSDETDSVVYDEINESMLKNKWNPAINTLPENIELHNNCAYKTSKLKSTS